MDPNLLAGSFSFRILYVDDDVRLGGLYAELLRSRGYEVHFAHGGFAALAALRQSLPDLVISDLRMPGMSGLELLAVIRQRFPGLPLLAVSGDDGLAAAALTADAAIGRAEAPGQKVYELVARLLHPPTARRAPAGPSPLPWVARRPGRDSWLTCGECLRAFRVPAAALALADAAGVRICACPHCGTPQRFVTGDGEAA